MEGIQSSPLVNPLSLSTVLFKVKYYTEMSCVVRGAIDSLLIFSLAKQSYCEHSTTAISAETASHLIKRALKSKHVLLRMSTY